MTENILIEFKEGYMDKKIYYYKQMKEENNIENNEKAKDYESQKDSLKRWLEEKFNTTLYEHKIVGDQSTPSSIQLEIMKYMPDFPVLQPKKFKKEEYSKYNFQFCGILSEKTKINPEIFEDNVNCTKYFAEKDINSDKILLFLSIVRNSSSEVKIKESQTNNLTLEERNNRLSNLLAKTCFLSNYNPATEEKVIGSEPKSKGYSKFLILVKTDQDTWTDDKNTQTILKDIAKKKQVNIWIMNSISNNNSELTAIDLLIQSTIKSNTSKSFSDNKLISKIFEKIDLIGEEVKNVKEDMKNFKEDMKNILKEIIEKVKKD